MLITGGSRGIGAATAKLAAQRGWDVAITYVENASAAGKVVGAIEAAGRKGIAIKADTGNLDDITRAFTRVDEVFGRLDAFFNNAGIFGPAVPFIDIDRARIARIIAINTTGAMVAAQEAARRMAKARGGRGGSIVHMSSIASKLGGAMGTVDYGASKGALDSLTVGMAKELAAEGVRVNAVRPGLIDTEIHASAGDPGRVARLASAIPMMRGGAAEEVAEAVLWLCSDASSYTTGQLLDVAGGRGL